MVHYTDRGLYYNTSLLYQGSTTLLLKTCDSTLGWCLVKFSGIQ